MKNLILSIFISMIALVINPAYGAEGKNHVPGVFAGITHVDGETDLTWGLEYEYKINSTWGVGVSYEDLPNGHEGDGVSVKVANLFYHPDSNWRIGVGYGEEKIGGYKPKTKNLYRLVGSYDFHLGDFGIAPTLAIDFVESGEDALVLGVAIVRPF